MWNARVLTTFRYLHVENKKESRSYELMPGVVLLTGRLKEKFIDEEFERAAGKIEFKHFAEASNIVAFDFIGQFCGEKPTSEIVLKIWLSWINWLLKDSWQVKDNSITCEIAYARVQSKQLTSWSNNGLYTQYSTAQGEREKPTTFNDAEIEYWNHICDATRSVVFSNGSMTKHATEKGSSRLARFFSFIDTSRTNNNPAIKISLCCSALESLFSTSTTELTHRLSERIAFFMGEHGHNKIETYDLIKECYAIRSMVTHGSATKMTHDDIGELNVKMMKTLKELAKIFLNNKYAEELSLSKNETIDNYFKELIIGK